MSRLLLGRNVDMAHTGANPEPTKPRTEDRYNNVDTGEGGSHSVSYLCCSWLRYRYNTSSQLPDATKPCAAYSRKRTRRLSVGFTVLPNLARARHGWFDVTRTLSGNIQAGSGLR